MDITSGIVESYETWDSLNENDFVLQDVTFKHNDLKKFDGSNAVFLLSNSTLVIESDEGEELLRAGLALDLLM